MPNRNTVDGGWHYVITWPQGPAFQATQGEGVLKLLGPGSVERRMDGETVSNADKTSHAPHLLPFWHESDFPNRHMMS